MKLRFRTRRHEPSVKRVEREVRDRLYGPPRLIQAFPARPPISPEVGWYLLDAATGPRKDRQS